MTCNLVVMSFLATSQQVKQQARQPHLPPTCLFSVKILICKTGTQWRMLMDFTNPAPLSIPAMVINMAIGLLLSVTLAFYYAHFGDSLSNRSRFAPILPTLSMITLLVIMVVKSSLALSLGLVGALSIVRFRTAIKDPEELIFLFFAIAIGLGLGAEQRIPTLIAFLVIMGYLITRKAIRKTFHLVQPNSLFLNISLPMGDTSDEEAFNFVQLALAEELKRVDLRRFDSDGDEMRLVFYVNARNANGLARIANHIHQKYNTALVSVVEQNNLLGG